MGDTYNAFSNRAEWAQLKLRDYGDYSDCVEYVEQEEDYGDSLRGQWYYADESPATTEETDDGETLPFAVIYWGSFGNYNCPGADSYTYATVYDDQDEYEEDLAKWEAKEEYLESENEEEDDNDNEEE